MFSFITNFYIFLFLLLFMTIEYFFSNILNISYMLPWLITFAVYFIIVFVQIMSKASEETEKRKIKEVIDELYSTVYGIPLLNKNDQIIIKWDIIFKKLLDKGEYNLYDKITKLNTTTISKYINKYPSLLLDNKTDLTESKYRIDLNSELKGKGKKKEDKELVDAAEYKTNIFIKELGNDRVSIGNYDNTIHMDVLLKNEYYPENYDKLEVETDEKYDGFSVELLYNKEKYTIVPRFMVFDKRIDKEKWFYRNVNNLIESAKKILKKEDHYTLDVNEINIKEYTEDMSTIKARNLLEFEYVTLDDKYLIFKSKSKENILVYCEFDTSYNNFQLVLKNYIKYTKDKPEAFDVDKVIAIGNSYQPLITLLQKMPQIIVNINLVMNNKDITEIVIK